MVRPAILWGLALVSTLGTFVGCGADSPLDETAQALTVKHAYDLADHMPAHLATMFSMSWFGIPASDPQGPGPDASYANAAVSLPCTGAQANPSACDTCILQGAGDACLQTGAPQRSFASRRRPLAGIYSASARDLEGRRRVDLMLSTLRRPCDDGAKVDTWAVQIDGTHNTSLNPGNPSCTACDMSYHALTAFLDEADAAQMKNAVMPADDATWYFHFSSAAGLGRCDDSPGNPKQSCIDALTRDFVDLATLADAHPSSLRLNGIPVLFTYFDPAHLSPLQWQSVLQAARNAVGHDFYAIATIQSPSHSEYFAAFDALAPWIQLDWSSTSGPDLRSHARAFTAGEHDVLYSNVDLYPGRVVFGGVAPGFDDFTESWGQCVERQLPPGQPRDPDFLSGEFDYLKSKAPAGLILETWDDWTEGTEFEPDVAGGTAELVALRRQLGELYGEPADPAADARLDQRWTQYGQARNCDGGSAGLPPITTLSCPAVAVDGGAGDLAPNPIAADAASSACCVRGDAGVACAPSARCPTVACSPSCGGCAAVGPGPLPRGALPLMVVWLAAAACWRVRRRDGGGR
jgi:hypothetical protein